MRSDVPLELTDEQRAHLLRVKLTALVGDLTGREAGPELLGGNVAAVVDGTAYLLASDARPSALAGAMAWAQRRDAGGLVLFVDDLGGTVVRMATYFTLPVDIRAVEGATSRSVPPDELPDRPEVLDDDALHRQLLDAGLEVVTEAGIVRGEVRGLEVARLVVWPRELGGDGALHLEAGVGRFDRDAVAAMHQGEPPEETLTRAISMVRAERRPGAGAHPLALLARERWLRAELVDDPAVVGATELHPVETTVIRDSVRESAPAAAAGRDDEGRPVLVVCSTGVDLSLVPVAADTRAWHDPSARLVLAVPPRDRVPALERLVSLLRDPAEIVTVPEPWVAPTGTAP